ncbi:hypothetical protein BU15DRAFT_60657 [Melanogaster broomeanus]|nr:hypothetical protein BU15DRAFT_60657 [Melanogaster broomeanus]
MLCLLLLLWITQTVYLLQARSLKRDKSCTDLESTVNNGKQSATWLSQILATAILEHGNGVDEVLKDIEAMDRQWHGTSYTSATAATTTTTSRWQHHKPRLQSPSCSPCMAAATATVRRMRARRSVLVEREMTTTEATTRKTTLRQTTDKARSFSECKAIRGTGRERGRQRKDTLVAMRLDAPLPTTLSHPPHRRQHHRPHSACRGSRSGPNATTTTRPGAHAPWLASPKSRVLSLTQNASPAPYNEPLLTTNQRAHTTRQCDPAYLTQYTGHVQP